VRVNPVDEALGELFPYDEQGDHDRGGIAPRAAFFENPASFSESRSAAGAKTLCAQTLKNYQIFLFSCLLFSMTN